MNLEENYFKNNFTKENNKINLNINQLDVDCITSNKNTFSLDEEGNLVVKSITAIDPIIGMIYPIGAIYLSTNDINPEEYFGGNWIQIKERFLFGCGDNYPNGTTGGEKEHILTINEMPSHNHNVSNLGQTFIAANGGYAGVIGDWGTRATDHIGNSQAHNNMPPYLAVYIWRRVA